METQQMNPSPTATPPSIPSGWQQVEQPLYVSQTVQNLHPDERPNPSTLCETCPGSLWFTSAPAIGQQVTKCMCRPMNAITWQPGAAAILACDGREQEIAKLIAAMSKQ